ncbi:putative RNA-directed DNA polymerase [Tanacetum coccineum]
MSTSSNSTNSNQQTLADSGANERPPMLEKGNYIPWESRFRRFLDNKLEDGERMWNSIQNGPYQRPMVVDPTNPTVPILEPLSKMTEGNKKQYIADVRVMNYLLQAIPNDIYNSVDACKNAKEMWERIKRLMHGSEITTHVRHSRLMDEFDKFAAKEGESLDSVHERLTTLVNIMDRNNVRPIPVAINTKFLNCLQPEWSKYVTMVRHNQTGPAVSYDVLYDQLVQFEPHVLASRAKKAAKNHDPLALIAHSNASSSHSHANSSYSPQPYYVTHPPSVVDYDDEYQGELQGDSQEDKLTTAMMNQAVVQDGRVDIQTKNAGYGGNANKNVGRTRTQGFNAGDESNQIIQRVPRTESTPDKANVQCYNCNEKGHYARKCQKPKVRDSKYFREQMLLAMKDEAGSNLSNEENDFMLDTSYGEDLEELTTAVILMAQLQSADENAETVPSYDAKAVSQGKSKKASLPPKLVPSTKSKLELLHMDLCRPMRVASINGKKYILVMVDDYSRYTWNLDYTNFNDSSEDSQSVPSTSDLDNLFGPMYEEYYPMSLHEVFDNSVANTLDNDHTSSSSSIVVDQDDAPQIVSFS